MLLPLGHFLSHRAPVAQPSSQPAAGQTHSVSGAAPVTDTRIHQSDPPTLTVFKAAAYLADVVIHGWRCTLVSQPPTSCSGVSLAPRGLMSGPSHDIVAAVESGPMEGMPTCFPGS